MPRAALSEIRDKGFESGSFGIVINSVRNPTFLASIDPGACCFDEVFEAFNDAGSEVALNEILNNELEGIKVLVVDDSIDNQELIEYYLVMSGAEVEICESGLLALKKTQSFHFDIVLMDIQMPGMDGNTAMRALRELMDPHNVSKIQPLN